MMVFDGYIGAPPTLTVVSADAGTAVMVDTSAKAASAVAASKLRRIDMVMLLRSGVGWKAALPPVERRSRPRPPMFVGGPKPFRRRAKLRFVWAAVSWRAQSHGLVMERLT